jgi:hypothetical protein
MKQPVFRRLTDDTQKGRDPDPAGQEDRPVYRITSNQAGFFDIPKPSLNLDLEAIEFSVRHWGYRGPSKTTWFWKATKGSVRSSWQRPSLSVGSG